MTFPRGRRGFALVTTLWVLAVLASVGVIAMAAARAERRATLNAATEARARWAAAGGLAMLLEALQDGSAEHSLTVLSQPTDSASAIRIQLNGFEARVAVVDAGSRLNLNRGDSLELQRLLEVLGIPRLKAAAVTAAVLDWRDPDSFRRINGAELPEYAGLNPPAAPRNGSFDSETEIRQVLGVDEALAAQLVPLTGTAGDGRINVNSAPPAVLAALSGVSLAGAQRLVSRRQRAGFQNVYEVLAALPREEARQLERDVASFQARIAFVPQELVASISATDRGIVAYRQRAVVRMGGGATIEILRTQSVGLY